MAAYRRQREISFCAPRKIELVQEIRHPGAGLGLAHALMAADRLDDLAADGVERIERGHRLLEDHAELAAAAHVTDTVDDLVVGSVLVPGAEDGDLVAGAGQGGGDVLDVDLGPAALGVAGVAPVAEQHPQRGIAGGGHRHPSPPRPRRCRSR